MDASVLANAMGNLHGVDYSSHLAGCINAMRLAQCDTSVRRAAMFLAQIGTESIGLRYSEEIATGAAYEGRVDLGNVQPGDGVLFKGRTFIQITGRHNYTMLSQWAWVHRLVPSENYFVLHPEQLASTKYVWLGPVWYWTVARPQLNALADANDINGATRVVNGGLNGLADRTNRWKHCLSLGRALLPPSNSKDWLDNMDEATLDLKLNALRDALNRSAARGGSLYVQFIDDKKSPRAVYRVDGGYLLWMDALTWQTMIQRYGGEPYRVGLTTRSHLYQLPTAPGTVDPRK